MLAVCLAQTACSKPHAYSRLTRHPRHLQLTLTFFQAGYSVSAAVAAPVDILRFLITQDRYMAQVDPAGHILRPMAGSFGQTAG